MLLGGVFSMVADDLARTLLPGEIPLGILTSAIGAILFIYLMVSMGIKVRSHG
jgi:iron complex transport system permease protein